MSSKGFTLIELLVVIVIIGLLAALLVPVVVAALCTAKEGVARARIESLSHACGAYYTDHNVYPPGRGTGSRELALAISAPSRGGQIYVEFREGDLHPATGDVLNPVHAARGLPEGIIYYRNNRAGGGVTVPPPRSRNHDFWAAGCSYDPARPESAGSLNSWD